MNSAHLFTYVYMFSSFHNIKLIKQNTNFNSVIVDVMVYSRNNQLKEPLRAAYDPFF